MSEKQCKDCGVAFPETREYFGQFKNTRGGVTTIGFRNQCRKCMAKNTKRHSQENPDSVRERLDRRKQLERATSGEISVTRIKALRVLLDHKCRYCGRPLTSEYEVDHLTPISRGGTNSDGNMTLACLSCNREKGSKVLTEYYEWRKERGLPVRDVRVPGEKPDRPNSSFRRRAY